MIKTLDPRNINQRLYNQLAKLLDQMENADSYEEITIRERIAALVAIARIQTLFVGLRKENKDQPNAGSTVRKYQSAFAPSNVGRRRKANARSGAASDDDDAAIADALRDDGDDDAA